MSDVEKFSVLPDNASLLERGIEFAFKRLLYEIENPYPDLLNPSLTPAKMLPYLANDRGVTEWDTNADEFEKRCTVQSIWPIRRLSGTAAAIRYAVESLGMSVDIMPWYKTGANPYTFYLNIYCDDVELTSELNTRLDARVSEAFAERDQFSINLARGMSCEYYIGVLSEQGITIESTPFVPAGSNSLTPNHTAVAIHSREISTSEPYRNE
jgi:phage tail P2-like protein